MKSLLISTTLTALTLAVVPPGTAGTHERVLRLDDGRVLQGVVREISPQRLLIQTDHQLFELGADRIDTIDGLPMTSASITPSKRLITSVHYVRISADGATELWTRNRTANHASSVLTSLSWGATEHELEDIRTMRAFDGFGNRLEHHVEPPTKVRPNYQVTVELVLPVPPGETVDLALRYRLTGAVQAVDGGFKLAFPGDFPDDRLYTRIVCLPPGATIEKMTPEPTEVFDHSGSPHVVWRRYYPARYREDLVVEYSLPAQD